MEGKNKGVNWNEGRKIVAASLKKWIRNEMIKVEF